MTVPSEADGAALRAIQGAMQLPDGNPVAVLCIYRTQCEHEARREERERVLKEIADAAWSWRETAAGRAYSDDLHASLDRLRHNSGVTLDPTLSGKVVGRDEP